MSSDGASQCNGLQPCGFEELPLDAVSVISMQLNADDISRARLVSRSWNDLFSDEVRCATTEDPNSIPHRFWQSVRSLNLLGYGGPNYQGDRSIVSERLDAQLRDAAATLPGLEELRVDACPPRFTGTRHNRNNWAATEASHGRNVDLTPMALALLGQCKLHTLVLTGAPAHLTPAALRELPTLLPHLTCLDAHAAAPLKLSVLSELSCLSACSALATLGLHVSIQREDHMQDWANVLRSTATITSLTRLDLSGALCHTPQLAEALHHVGNALTRLTHLACQWDECSHAHPDCESEMWADPANCMPEVWAVSGSLRAFSHGLQSLALTSSQLDDRLWADVVCIGAPDLAPHLLATLDEDTRGRFLGRARRTDVAARVAEQARAMLLSNIGDDDGAAALGKVGSAVADGDDDVVDPQQQLLRRFRPSLRSLSVSHTAWSGGYEPRWLHVLQSSCTSLSLMCDDYPQLPEGLCQLTGLRSLALTLKGWSYGKGDGTLPRLLRGLSHLTRLDVSVSNFSLTAYDVHAVARECPRLQQLVLGPCGLFDCAGWAWGFAPQPSAFANLSSLVMLRDKEPCPPCNIYWRHLPPSLRELRLRKVDLIFGPVPQTFEAENWNVAHDPQESWETMTMRQMAGGPPRTGEGSGPLHLRVLACETVKLYGSSRAALDPNYVPRHHHERNSGDDNSFWQELVTGANGMTTLMLNNCACVPPSTAALAAVAAPSGGSSSFAWARDLRVLHLWDVRGLMPSGSALADTLLLLSSARASLQELALVLPTHPHGLPRSSGATAGGGSVNGGGGRSGGGSGGRPEDAVENALLDMLPQLLGLRRLRLMLQAADATTLPPRLAVLRCLQLCELNVRSSSSASVGSSVQRDASLLALRSAVPRSCFVNYFWS